TAGVEFAVEHTIKELKLPAPDKEKLNRFVGPPMQDSFIREYGLSREEAQMAANLFRKNYVKKSLFMADLYPGIKEVLQYLKSKAFKIGVATYKREDYAIDIMKHFGIALYCDVMHGADNENVLKKEDIINMCLSEMDICNRESVVLIGDSEYDAIGAEKAGIDFFGVRYGFGFKEKEKLGKYKAIGWGVEIKDVLKYL
ncbi:HAD hydrolase-like protein, partial [Lacrimispora sp.]|uniref:HAD hydrolase-like protein n=1 Tax=Lacrimispora sp. TaxID=2719234 RepID=UPI0028AE0B92